MIIVVWFVVGFASSVYLWRIMSYDHSDFKVSSLIGCLLAAIPAPITFGVAVVSAIVELAMWLYDLAVNCDLNKVIIRRKPKYGNYDNVRF